MQVSGVPEEIRLTEAYAEDLEAASCGLTIHYSPVPVSQLQSSARLAARPHKKQRCICTANLDRPLPDRFPDHVSGKSDAPNRSALMILDTFSIPDDFESPTAIFSEYHRYNLFGFPGHIPPDSKLIFDVELKEIEGKRA
ncbi:hypothetical protein BU24DRAFT_458994 [Aaosphaeria arxii CBS 175.79]|uniref:Uncharacterized protein n=1 Tax=Aaosphaeria arxii CBS 175.79 TaxID=1450172 RepID=A0A6A5Y2P6_9PLEO|nr:uncharacterized protein BU24DRAFT_458994 [Aaosphaeria arxii CBS 175.79]KAF2019307.1 hypothetical protein BU24DRAFT_458994 [Aaosphaeria arxii CBS 175.79]